mmetsp:Transcript_19120/g.25935  ORF Transcript_19120/g.25935 Transcript_19120/m.25935 type:complete len:84 (+) Transcript_19120:423-674(+)
MLITGSMYLLRIAYEKSFQNSFDEKPRPGTLLAQYRRSFRSKQCPMFQMKNKVMTIIPSAVKERSWYTTQDIAPEEKCRGALV